MAFLGAVPAGRRVCSSIWTLLFLGAGVLGRRRQKKPFPPKGWLWAGTRAGYRVEGSKPGWQSNTVEVHSHTEPLARLAADPVTPPNPGNQ